MARASKIALGVLVLFFGISCGEQEKDYSGTLGSCSMSTGDAEQGTEIKVCLEYSYTAKEKKDPGEDAANQVKGDCEKIEDLNAVYSRNGSCVETDSVGICDGKISKGDASVTLKTVIYGKAATDENIKALCDALQTTVRAKS